VADRPTVDRRDGSIVLTLHEREVQVLQWVFSDLGRMLSDDSSVDVVTQRLFPRAYLDPTEEAAENQWQAVVHGDLVETRLGAMTDVVRSLDAAQPVRGMKGVRELVLGEDLTAHWIGVLNDARLAVGTALNVTPEWDFDALETEDPSYELHALYAWMTELLGALLGAVGG
jgi:hypothetical protein